MKTIIVATDFSPAARNATLYAVQLARSFGARLILFHAYNTPLVPITEELPVVTAGDMKQVVEQSLWQEMMAVDPTVEVTLRTDSKQGEASAAILQAVREQDADLVVLGMKATGRSVRKVFGSTVTTLSHKTQVPLLVVPEEISFRPVETVVVAYDTDLAPDDDAHVLDAVRAVASRFNSKVYLVHVAKTEFREIYQVMHKPYRLSRMMTKLDPVFETIRSKSIGVALDRFIKEHDVNILAMMPEKKTLLSRWFSTSITRLMAFRSVIPLLLLPGYHEGKKLWWTKALAGKTTAITPLTPRK